LSAPAPGDDDLAEFYIRFNKVKDFHRQNTNINARTFLNEIDELVRSDGLQTVYVEDEEEPIVIDPLDSVFSGEEAYGKRMDLYQAHSQYLNLRGANRLSYVAFLDMLRRGYVEKTLDMKERGSTAYLEYVQTIYNYLLSFFDRALPLVNVQQKLKEEEDTFASAWEAGQIGGWQKGDDAPSEGIWCEYCTCLGSSIRSTCQPNVQARNHIPNKQYTMPTSPRPSTRKKSRPAKRPPTLPLRPLPLRHHQKTSSAPPRG
jgi:splicing factor 3A subunit 3